MKLLTITSLFLAICMSAPVSAQQPVPSQNKSLASRVTIGAQGWTLEQLLYSLEAKGRPQLEAGRSVKWDRVTIIEKGQSLGQVMAGLSELFHYNWQEDSHAPAPGRFTLTQSGRSLEYERQLWQDTLERAAAPLFAFTRYLQTPAEEYLRMKQQLEAEGKEPEDPLLRNDNLNSLRKPEYRASLELLGTLTPDQRLRLLADSRYFLSWSEMNTRQRELAQVIAEFIGKFRTREPADPGREGEKPEDSGEYAQRFGIVLSIRTDPITGALGPSYNFGLGGEEYHGINVSVFPKPLDLLPVRGNPYLRLRGNALPVYGDLERKPFPKDFKLEPGQVTPWPKVMEKLAMSLAMPVYSDDFIPMPPSDADSKMDMTHLSQMSLAEGLDALCTRYHYVWWRGEGRLYFRSRDWFIQRQYEVPPPVLTLVRQQLAAKGQLDTKALTTLSILTPRQLQGLSAMTAVSKGALNLRLTDPSAFRRFRGSFDRNMLEAYGYLQLFALLDENQKLQALAPEGLALETMTRQQQQAFVQMIAANFGPDAMRQLPRMRFQIAQSQPTDSRNAPSFRVVRVSFTCNAFTGSVSVSGTAGIGIAYRP